MGGSEDGDKKALSIWDEIEWKQVVEVVVICAVILAVGIFSGSSILHEMIKFRSWFVDEQPWSLFVYIIVFTIAVLCLLPVSAFSIAIGFIYGVGYGLLVQLAALTFASVVMFIGGRTFLKDWVATKVRSNNVLHHLQLKLGETSVATKLNLLLCFTPMPFAFHVYLFAVTELSPLMFFFTFIPGLVPFQILFLISGHALFKLGEGAAGTAMHTTESIMLGLGAVVSIAVIAYCVHLVQTTLKEIEALPDAAPSEASSLLPEGA